MAGDPFAVIVAVIVSAAGVVAVFAHRTIRK